MLTHKVSRFGAAAVTLVLVPALLAVSLALWAGTLVAADPAEEPRLAEDVTALRKMRVELARKGYDLAVPSLRETRRIENVLSLVGKPEEIYRWSVRWLQAQREMSRKNADPVDALQAHLRRMIELEQEVGKLTAVGVYPKHTQLDAEWYRLEAQLWLAEEKAKE